MHPVDLCDDFGVPGARVADLEDCSLVECDGRDWLVWLRVLDDGDSRTWHVGVHKQVALIKVPLHQGFVLLSVLTRDDQVVLR